MERENPLSSGFIVLFTEDSIAQEKKKYVRFFEDNKVTKENLSELKLTGLNISDRFQAQQKYFDTARFHDLVKSLLPVDYALLIQKDNSIKHKNRFSLSHFHVRIDCFSIAPQSLWARSCDIFPKTFTRKGTITPS